MTIEFIRPILFLLILLSHSEQDFYFSIDNAVGGRVFDTNGKALENVCLSLLPARGKKTRYFYQSDCTDKNGAFRFDQIPAGTYVIIVNEKGKITADEPFGTFYYPSAIGREEAAEITVGAGDFHENLIVNAPETAEGWFCFCRRKRIARSV